MMNILHRYCDDSMCVCPHNNYYDSDGGDDHDCIHGYIRDYIHDYDMMSYYDGVPCLDYHMNHRRYSFFQHPLLNFRLNVLCQMNG